MNMWVSSVFSQANSTIDEVSMDTSIQERFAKIDFEPLTPEQHRSMDLPHSEGLMVRYAGMGHYRVICRWKNNLDDPERCYYVVYMGGSNGYDRIANEKAYEEGDRPELKTLSELYRDLGGEEWVKRTPSQDYVDGSGQVVATRYECVTCTANDETAT